METIFERKVKVPTRELELIGWLMRCHGIKNSSLSFDGQPSTATITFTDEAEYLICVLAGIMSKAKEESGDYYFIAPDFDFMNRLEKKMKTYSPNDEYIIRKVMKER
jgi:hypothetical protein